MIRAVFGVAVLFLLLTAAAVPTFSQKTKLPSEDIPAAVGIAERKLDSASFRVVHTTEWFDRRDGDVINRSVETFATVPTDRYQYITENGSTRIETIVIEGTTYRRTNDEDWESVAVPPIKKAGSYESAARFGAYEGGSHTPMGNGRLIARGTIDGQEVTQYEVRKVSADSTPDGMTRSEITNVWINREGLIVRKIVEHDMVGDTRFMRATSNYTYGDIQIAAPVIPGKIDN